MAEGSTGYLIVNPRSGGNGVEGLLQTARALGIEYHVLSPGDDAGEIARRADAQVLGMAGGDGSLASVVAVAIERDLAFVCVPSGTRNHFAPDAGLDRNDPSRALAAFTGVERRIDVARVNGRLFMNNLSLGLYADLVSRRERHRRRGEALRRRRLAAEALGRTRRLAVSAGARQPRGRRGCRRRAGHASISPRARVPAQGAPNPRAAGSRRLLKRRSSIARGGRGPACRAATNRERVSRLIRHLLDRVYSR